MYTISNLKIKNKIFKSSNKKVTSKDKMQTMVDLKLTIYHVRVHQSESSIVNLKSVQEKVTENSEILTSVVITIKIRVYIPSK